MPRCACRVKSWCVLPCSPLPSHRQHAQGCEVLWLQSLPQCSNYPGHSRIHPFVVTKESSIIYSLTTHCCHPSTHLFIHPSVRPSVRSFIHSFVHSLVHSLICLSVWSFVCSLVHPFIHPSIHPSLHSFVYSMAQCRLTVAKL
jgi:hypothetical protein